MPTDIWKWTPEEAFPHPAQSDALSGYLGMEMLERGPDFVRGRMPVDARTVQNFGRLHGGASVALAETLMSFGAAMCVDRATRLIVGQEINANHLRGVTTGWVIGTARPVHLGGSSQVWECRIEDERGALVCISRMTAAVLERKLPA